MGRLKDVGSGLLAQVCPFGVTFDTRISVAEFFFYYLFLQMRPWGEILDRQSYSKPGDFSEVSCLLMIARP